MRNLVIQIYKLSFTTPVHFGDRRLSDNKTTITADTLFSALFIEALKLNKDTDFLLNDIKMSDTFPFLDDTLYLPKPLIPINAQHDNATDYKVFKKLKYIPADLYLNYVKGEFTSEDAIDTVEDLYLGNSDLLTKVSLQNIETKDGEAEPYSVGLFRYNSNAGIYFIVEGEPESLNQFSEVIESLQYSGICGKRTSGYGQFECRIEKDEDIEMLITNKGEQSILLSTAMATKDELAESIEGARYLLNKKSGFIQSETYSETLVKKKDFYSFASGSVFKNKFEGSIFDVGENGSHPVYRYAKALWMEV